MSTIYGGGRIASAADFDQINATRRAAYYRERAKLVMPQDLMHEPQPRRVYGVLRTDDRAIELHRDRIVARVEAGAKWTPALIRSYLKGGA
jgi:hypothetical protein